MVLPWLVAPNLQADSFAGAEWLRDTVFKGVPPGSVLSPKPVRQDHLSLTNIHTYFRKEIELPAKPVKALLDITGDDYYKFYVNGQFVVQGPEPGYPFAQPYYAIDISRFLDQGRNCLASHAYYHGLVCRAWNSGDNRSGFMLTLDLTFPDGSTAHYATDPTWKCLTSRTFSANRTFGYDTQFNENIDMRLEPIGWRENGFDDADWLVPLCGRQDHVFVKQITPPLEHERVEPALVKQLGAGHYFFDFGGEIVGHTRLRLHGSAGQVVTVRHGEELAGPFQVRYQMRCNCIYEDHVTLSGGGDLAEFYDYRGFRYLELSNAPAKPEVWVDVRHHPFDESASEFKSSDDLLNRIWDLSKRGIEMGCQGVFVDCPTREKGQYTGDTYLTALSQLILTADPSLARKALKDFQQSQRFDAGLLAVAPGSYRQELAEWSFCWVFLLRYYY